MCLDPRYAADIFLIFAKGIGDLEERVTGQGSGRIEDLHQSLERQVLVLERRQVNVTNTSEQFSEGGISSGIGSQDQRIDEEPDQIVKVLVRAASHSRAEGNVRPRSQPGEQCGQCGLPHHEWRDVLLACHRKEPGVDCRAHGELDTSATMAGGHRTRAVSGQGQFCGKVSQGPLPEGGLPGEDTGRVILSA